MYKKLSGKGQIKEGDNLILVLADGKIIRSKAKIVIDPNGKEEVVYNKSKNYYFIVSMVLDGSSYVKAVCYCSLDR